MGKTYRAGVLGMGNMGRAHAGILLDAPDVELVALCSQPAADAQKYAAGKGLSCAIYADGFEMIEKEALDILYVCLPPFAHSGQVEAAAARGCAVFVEKPIALTAERGRAMAEAVEKAGVVSQVGYQMRFGGAVRALVEAIADGRAGRPLQYTARYECNSLHTPWWIDVTKCGGQVFEQVIHLYDMGLYLMGKPDTVCGFTANLAHQNVPGYTVEDTSVSAIRFKSGGLGMISGSNCAVPGRWEAMFRVVCEHLVADFKDQDHATFTWTDGEKPRTEDVDFSNDVTRQEDAYFLEAVRGNHRPFATVAEGYTGLRMVGGVVASSAAGGAPVTID